VSAGTNTYTLLAFDPQGAQVGTTSIVVTGSGGVFPAGPGSLAVSEINYNPPGSTDATEFIELLNVTAATLNLAGCHFDEELGQGISYTFPTGVQLNPGARILVVRDTTAFNARYGGALNVAPGVFTGALDNSGESIVLYAASGLEIFRFSYPGGLDAADGAGKSLVRQLSSTNPTGAEYSWRASTADGGNPGTTDGIPFTGTALADVDGDSFPAMIEYAFGTNDNDAASRPPAPTITFNANGTVSVNYALIPNADDIIATIESSANAPTAWQPITGPVPADPARFFRFKATLR